MIRKALLSCICLFILTIGFSLKAKSLFSIIDDDASSVSAIESIKGLADSKGIKISYAVIAGRLIDNPDIANALLSFQDEGFTICDHSFTHDRCIWSSGDTVSIVNEIVRSTTILDSIGFSDHNYFVYPFGKFPPDRQEFLNQIIGNRYKLAFDSRGDINVLDTINPYNIARFPIRRHENISIVKLKIDNALKHGPDIWIVFLTHSGNPRDYSDEYLGEVIDYCLSKGLECVTVQDAYAQILHNVPKNKQIRHYTNLDEILNFAIMHIWYVLPTVILPVLILILLLRFRKRDLTRRQD